MIIIRTIQDLYPAIDEIIIELGKYNPNLATLLEYRMHKAAWTTRSELFEELERVISSNLRDGANDMPKDVQVQLERILTVIRGNL